MGRPPTLPPIGLTCASRAQAATHRARRLSARVTSHMFEAGEPLLALLTASIRGHQPHSPAGRTTRTRARKKAPASSILNCAPKLGRFKW